jgi:hypothetical protein
MSIQKLKINYFVLNKKGRCTPKAAKAYAQGFAQAYVGS